MVSFWMIKLVIREKFRGLITGFWHEMTLYEPDDINFDEKLVYSLNMKFSYNEDRNKKELEHNSWHISKEKD